MGTTRYAILNHINEHKVARIALWSYCSAAEEATHMYPDQR